MAHNLDNTNGRWNIAYAGSRGDVWHRLGQERMEGKTKAEWIAAAGLDWQATLVPATITYPLDYPVADKAGRTVEIPGRFYNTRSDNGFVLSDAMLASDRYENVQSTELVDFVERFFSVDDRFSFDVLGSLDGGRRIWALASYREHLDVAGEKHQAYLLASTTYDGSGATIVQATTTRVVCNNTIRVAHGDRAAQIKIRHNTRFNPEQAGKQLAQLAQSTSKYKAIGDALAQNEMSRTEVSQFFKQLLEIPFDAAKEDISTRKMNMFSDLSDAYKTSVQEGAADGTAWASLQAVTRYCDHDRSTRGGDGTTAGRLEAQVTSNFWGSGDALKGKAMGILMPRIKDKVLVSA